MANDDLIDINLVCLGVRRNGDKTVRVFKLVGEDNEPYGSEAVFTKIRKGGCCCIYKARGTLDEDGELQTLVGQSLQLQSIYRGEKAVEYKALNDAAETEVAALKQAQNEQKDNNPVMACLEPLKRVYARSTFQQRLAMEVRILEYLRR